MRLHRGLTALLYGATMAGVCTLAVSSLTYFDFWWFLKSGELIVATRSVPTVDPFSFTAQGRPWINHMWATQVLFYVLWEAGGRVSLILLKGAVVTATFGIALSIMRRRGVHPVLASAVTLLAAWAGREFWHVRPQIFSFLLLATFLWLLREGWERRRRVFVLIPLLMILWANLHAGFLTGIGIIALVGVGSALPQLWDRERRAGGWRTARRAAALVAIATLASLVNPFGLRAIQFPIEAMSTRAFMVSTQEWFSPNFHDPVYRGFEIVLLLLFPAFAWGRARLTATDVIIALTCLHLALVSQRHIPLFLIVAAAPLADGLGTAVRSLWERRAGEWRVFSRLRPSLPDLWPLALAPTTHLAAASFLILVGLAAAWSALVDPRANPFVLDLNERRYPERAVSFIKEERLPAPLFNDYSWGGYELWRLYPDYRVFMDGRTHVYGREVLRDFLEVTDVGPRWQAVLDRWGIQTIFVRRPSRLVQALEAAGGWRPVFAEREAVVFVRETEAHRPLLARLPAVSLSEPAPEMTSALSAALKAVEAGDDAQAVRWYRHALALAPDHPLALFGLGLVMERRGERAEARTLFARVAARHDHEELAQQARERLARLR